MKTKMTSYLAGLTLLASAATSFAGVGTVGSALSDTQRLIPSSSSYITAQITMLNINISATGSKSVAGTTGHGYLTTEQSAHQTIVINGHGRLSSLNQTTSQDQTVVIGQDVQGYAKVVLKSGGTNKILMNTDQDLTAESGGVTVHMAMQLDEVGVLTKGTWDSYAKGGEIEFQLTPDSSKKEALALSDQVAKSIEESLQNSLSSQSVSTSSQAVVKDEGASNGTCTASLRKLECTDKRMDIQLLINIFGI